MRLAELFTDVSGNPEYVGCDADTAIEGLCVDSRAVGPQGAFLALAGATVDAHRFVDAALSGGAAVAIVTRGRIAPPSGPHVWLDDTAAAYPGIAANAHGRPADRLQLAAITGTNGKTTTAHLLDAILREAKHPYARLGTTGNWVVDREEDAGFTTPFPLELQGVLARTVARGGTHVVMEASSHALQQGRVQPLRFAAVGFTSFSQDHLDFHPTMEAYLQAKCLLASRHLAAGGTAVAAVDGQPASRTFLAAAPSGAATLRVSRGQDAAAEILASDIDYGATATRAHVRTPAGELSLHTPLLAPFNLDNALVALGIGLGLGIELGVIGEALRTAAGAPGRLQRVWVDGVAGPSVVVDYAHTPDAVTRALEAVRPLCRGTLHVVLGCGGDRDPKKRPLMGSAAAGGSDMFWATSDNPRTEDPAAIVDHMLTGVPGGARFRREVDRGSAIAAAVAAAAPEDLVLIAGKGHEDYQVLGTEKIHFDDREHARAALAKR